MLKKKGTIFNKGIVNNKISVRLFQLLEEAGVATHFLEQLSDREMRTKHLKIIQIEVVVRNRATGSLVKRLGLEEGLVLDPPLVEFFYKHDPLGDPLITEDHIRLLKLANDDQVSALRSSRSANQ